MSKNRSGYRGYVTSREFGGLRIPVPVQALILRDYCGRKGFLYKLHTNENMFPHSYMVLEGLMHELEIYEGILLTSMFMLPERAERRRKIYETVLGRGSELHFVMEEMVISRHEHIDAVEEILQIANTLPHCLKALPTFGGDSSP